MKRILTLAAAIACLPPRPLASREVVEIYADADPREFGRAPRREGILAFPFSEFSAVKTLAVPDPDGFLTAVLIDPRIVRSLETFLTGYRERRLAEAWLWLSPAAGRKIFHYYDDAAGLRFSFSAEEPGPEILAVVNRFYAGDRKTGDLVRRAYRENFVLRIHSAENLIEPWKDSLSFPEAMVVAGLIGNTDQPLWGIRDGKGLLRDLPEKIETKTALSLYHYRPIEKNEAAYLAFVRRVRSMEGSFPRNLHHLIAKGFRVDPDGAALLPEETVSRKTARGADLVLLAYDVLVRMGYQARVVSLGGDPDPPSLITLFREGERGDWGALTERDFFPDLAADWTRAPDLAAGKSISWRELDPDVTFRSRKPSWTGRASRP